MNLTELKNTPVSELVQLGESMGLENLARAHKKDIIFAILKAHAKGGEDIAALWRGRYTTHLGGLRVMRRLGWASVEDMGRALLGEPRATPLLAQRGDIVLTDTGLGFGVVIGATAVGLAPEGLTFAPLTSCRLAWPI